MFLYAESSDTRIWVEHPPLSLSVYAYVLSVDVDSILDIPSYRTAERLQSLLANSGKSQPVLPTDASWAALESLAPSLRIAVAHGLSIGTKWVIVPGPIVPLWVCTDDSYKYAVKHHMTQLPDVTQSVIESL